MARKRLAALRDALGEGRFKVLYEEGQSLSYEQAEALAREVLDG